MHAKAWLNAADFDKGLAVARARHRPLEAGVGPFPAAPIPAIDSIATSPPPQLERALSVEPAPIAPAPPAAPIPPLPPAESVKQASPDLQMKVDGGARFARPWRVWMKKT